MHRHLACVDAQVIVQIGDGAEQLRGALDHVAELLELSRREPLLAIGVHSAGGADHVVHRCAKLMTYTAQEFVLHTRRVLSFVARDLQFVLRFLARTDVGRDAEQQQWRAGFAAAEDAGARVNPSPTAAGSAHAQLGTEHVGVTVRGCHERSGGAELRAVIGMHELVYLTRVESAGIALGAAEKGVRAPIHPHDALILRIVEIDQVGRAARDHFKQSLTLAKSGGGLTFDADVANDDRQ